MSVTRVRPDRPYGTLIKGVYKLQPTPPIVRLTALVARVQYPGHTFEVSQEDSHCFLRVGSPEGKCNVTGSPMSWWGRKWRLSPHMTDGEVVATAFKALLTALEHEARELFLFDEAAVYDSHVDIHKLVALRKEPDALVGREDGR